MDKICTKCSKLKSLSEYSKIGNGKFRSECKVCKNKYSRNYAKSNKLKFKINNKTYYSKNKDLIVKKSRDHRLKRIYNISPEQYESLLISQNSVCWICKLPESTVKKGKLVKLSVDHDHLTGKIRGLLCMACNLGIGYFKDDSSRLMAAIQYLNRGE